MVTKILLYVIILLVVLYLLWKVKQVVWDGIQPGSDGPDGIEHFIDKMDYSVEYVMNEYKREEDDLFDKEYVDLYQIAYDNDADIKADMKIVAKHLPKEWLAKPEEMEIRVGGCGVGKMTKYWKEKGCNNVIGIDLSKNMLKKAEELNPNIRYIRGNLADPKILDRCVCNLFILDERTLYYNHEKDMMRIFQNIHGWLKEDGLIVVPVYDRTQLQVASRYYTTNYVDNMGIVHGFTYLTGFTHDCWYIPDIGDDEKGENASEILTLYYDKFTLEEADKDDFSDQSAQRAKIEKNLKKRIKSTMMYMCPKEDVYDMLIKANFEKVHIEPIGNRIVGGYELAIYRKKKMTASVKDLQGEKSEGKK